MSAALSYPSIYIEEIPSGARSIAGVATSMSDSTSLHGTTCNDDPNTKTGLYALKKADLFDLLGFPADTLGGDKREFTALLDRLSNHCRIRCEAGRHACFHML